MTDFVDPYGERVVVGGGARGAGGRPELGGHFVARLRAAGGVRAEWGGGGGRGAGTNPVVRAAFASCCDVGRWPLACCPFMTCQCCSQADAVRPDISDAICSHEFSSPYVSTSDASIASSKGPHLLNFVRLGCCLISARALFAPPPSAASPWKFGVRSPRAPSRLSSAWIRSLKRRAPSSAPRFFRFPATSTIL